MTFHHNQRTPSINSTLSGLVPLDIINLLKDITSSATLASTITIKFLLHLNSQIYYNIWLSYCIFRSSIQSSNNAVSYLPVSSLSTHQSSQPLPLTIASAKIRLWYPLWIKYQTNLNYIITNSQI
jgi:hypothetical protein